MPFHCFHISQQFLYSSKSFLLFRYFPWYISINLQSFVPHYLNGNLQIIQIPIPGFQDTYNYLIIQESKLPNSEGPSPPSQGLVKVWHSFSQASAFVSTSKALPLDEGAHLTETGHYPDPYLLFLSPYSWSATLLVPFVGTSRFITHNFLLLIIARQ